MKILRFKLEGKDVELKFTDDISDGDIYGMGAKTIKNHYKNEKVTEDLNSYWHNLKIEKS